MEPKAKEQPPCEDYSLNFRNRCYKQKLSKERINSRKIFSSLLVAPFRPVHVLKTVPHKNPKSVLLRLYVQAAKFTLRTRNVFAVLIERQQVVQLQVGKILVA